MEKTIVAGRLKDRNKMERRLDKIQARHLQVNDLHDVALKDTAEGVRLFCEIKEDRKHSRPPRAIQPVGRWRSLPDGPPRRGGARTPGPVII